MNKLTSINSKISKHVAIIVSGYNLYNHIVTVIRFELKSKWRFAGNNVSNIYEF